jgi:hypothetical protein
LKLLRCTVATVFAVFVESKLLQGQLKADVGVLFHCCHLKVRLRLLDVQISRENKGHATATFTTLLLLL